MVTINDLLEKAFSDGYEYAQKEFGLTYYNNKGIPTSVTSAQLFKQGGIKKHMQNMVDYNLYRTSGVSHKTGKNLRQAYTDGSRFGFDNGQPTMTYGSSIKKAMYESASNYKPIKEQIKADRAGK